MPARPPKDAESRRRAPEAKGSGGKESGRKAAARKCPICGKPATEASRPFCSERCRDVDLNRWLSGSYAIPGRSERDEDED